MAKIKRESWLIFYRTKNGKLSNVEIEDCDSKVAAMVVAKSSSKSFDRFELDSHGEPIVKRMQYV